MPIKYALTALCFSLLPLGAVAQTVPETRDQMALSFAPLVQQVAPAVVNIYAKRVVEGRESPFAGDPFFEQFAQSFGKPTQRVQNSLGSGVILAADGLVMSNYHVVGGATDISVVLSDRREFAATVILADEESDLALLRVESSGTLPYLPLRATDSVEVGELVLAIGNPFGVGQTVSSGIVSGLARSSVSLGRGYFIQTDAPVNPGNSGGALVDMAGRLIGINSAIITKSGGSNGVGFAIPSDLVAQVMAQAAAGNDHFIRPWAGVSGQTVDAQMAEALGMDRPSGIVLDELHPQSPFGQAGLVPGDVITGLDGAEVNSPQEIMFRLSVMGVGKRVKVAYVSGGQAHETEVTLIAAPQAENQVVLSVVDGGLAGLSVAMIDPALISKLGLPLSAQGVVITAVEGPLARAGMIAGDIVLGINGAEIKTPDDVRAVAATGARGWAMDILRAGQLIRLRFRL
ncbi:trypsin-like peptidase domain-containing protein [Pseudorhodobacter sp. W20_MBD10_FR17]|uniref:trypsin-like peptidase domain-containing protein n=1 Tax=Pseudorhodobacter sp. W20_MBD10_FR17 TaxID=3240266 RepID=UPI003F9AD7A9